MYQIFCDEYLLHDPRSANKEDKVFVLNAVLDLNVGSAGFLTFDIQFDHPYIDKLKRMSSIISVKSNGQTVFRGRIVKDRIDFRRTHVVEVEGLGAVLNDSIQEPFNFPMDYVNEPDYQQAVVSGNVVEYFISKILFKHNRQVSDNQQIVLGSVTVSDPNNYISRSSQDANDTWSTLEEKLVGSSLGGYFVFRYDDNGTYLDYVNSFATDNPQTIEFAKNLMDLTDETDGGELYNSIYAVGNEGLTLSSLPDGDYGGMHKDGSFLYDPVMVEKYGKITKIISWDDVTVVENLLNKAVRRLQDLSGVFPKTLSVSAFDLSLTEEEVPFAIAKNVMVYSEPHDLTESFPIMGIKINLIDPSGTSLTLSKESETYTETMQNAQSTINVIINDIKGVTTETKEDLTNRVVIAESALTQAGDNITALVAQIDDLNRQLTEIRTTAEGLNIRITEIQNNGADSIRTSTGYTFNADGLIISKSGEEMENKMDNTGLYVSRSGVPILTANNEGVDAINLHARNYLIIGTNDRFEDYSTPSDPHRTGAFYIGADW